MVSTYQQILHHSLQKKWNWYWHQQHWQAQSFLSSTHSQHNILFRIISLHPSTCASASDKSTSCASQRQNTRKAPGPDGISRFCLKACGDQLAPVFTQILSRSLNLCLNLTYYKYWTILLILWDFMTGMMTTGQLLSHRWSQFFKKKWWWWPTESTSQAPCWIPCCSPRGHSHRLMKQSLCTLFCNIYYRELLHCMHLFLLNSQTVFHFYQLPWRIGCNRGGCGNSYSALESPRDVYSPHCSFSSNTNDCTSGDTSLFWDSPRHFLHHTQHCGHNGRLQGYD